MQKKISIILMALVFGAMLIFAESRGLLVGFREVTSVIFSPVGRTMSGTGEGFNVFFSSLFNLGKLQKENAILNDENNELRANIARLKEVELENESLRKNLKFVSRTGFRYESANVIAFDPSSLRSMVTVDKGSAAGLRAGMAVTADGFLLGRVSEVSRETSKVQLVSDPTSAIPVSIQGTKINALAKGEIGLGVAVEKIPQGEKFKIGDTIITSGLGGEIPRGIIVGTIESTSSQENSLFVTAKVRPDVIISNVLRVLIIKE